jgi:hypothetical protein
MNMARCFIEAAQKRVETSENLTKAITVLKVATTYYTELRNWPMYAVAQTNLVLSYKDFVDHKIDIQANLLQMKLALEDGISIFRKYGLVDEERKFKDMIKDVDKVLAGIQKQAGLTPPSGLRNSSETTERAHAHFRPTISS